MTPIRDAGDEHEVGGPFRLAAWLRAFFEPDARAPGFLGARWVLLRLLGLWHFSVFYSLAFQIRGLIGDHGILPVSELFPFVARRYPGVGRFWLLPSLLWLAPSDRGLAVLVVAGLIASTTLVLNLAPRASLVVCGLAFASFVPAAGDFSSYQSDGMLLEATAAAFVFAPPGLLPRLGARRPPSRAARFVLLWECFRIYFESGVAKLASGDPSWRDFTAMDRYYENGPLPATLGWWAQQLPHGFHGAVAFVTLLVELALIFLVFGPRRVRPWIFGVLTALQLGIIATGNYGFLNYLVLSLGVLLLDDGHLAHLGLRLPSPSPAPPEARGARWRFWASSAWLGWLFYGSLAVFAFEGAPAPISWLAAPVAPLQHLRLANRYGLFARMTQVRYEVELQGSNDGNDYVPYRFKYKPQAQDEAPKTFAPYQPRFDWNLWFCAIDEEGVPPRYVVRMAMQTCPWVVRLERRLLEGSPDVLRLFDGDPFPGARPRYVRSVLWRYWMTDRETLRATGRHWRRELVGPYAYELEREPDGTLSVVVPPPPEDEPSDE